MRVVEGDGQRADAICRDNTGHVLIV